MKKVLLAFAVALPAVFLARSQTNGSRKNPLDGTWELVSGQQLPKGTIDIKIIAGKHFMFVAYDAKTGKPRYTGGGTCTLDGTSYTEHIDFMSDQIAADMIGKDQAFIVTVSGGSFTQKGVLTNGKNLSETWRRVK